MTASATKTDGNGQNGSLLRRCHRWLGVMLAIFVLLLACTGIALNHGSDWSLDKRFITSNWLLDAYGIRVPADAVSFADRGHRATLLGQRLYLDDREVADGIDALTGIASLDSLIVLTTREQALLFSSAGELVERMDVTAELAAPIERLGRAGERAAIVSGGDIFTADADVSRFEIRTGEPTAVAWSESSAVPDELLQSLQAKYRGRGLSVERVLADVHSGRIVNITGQYLMDAVGLLLIALSVTGIVMWARPRKKSQP
jgi:hypothetical protein